MADYIQEVTGAVFQSLAVIQEIEAEYKNFAGEDREYQAVRTVKERWEKRLKFLQEMPS